LHYRLQNDMQYLPLHSDGQKLNKKLHKLLIQLNFLVETIV